MMLRWIAIIGVGSALWLALAFNFKRAGYSRVYATALGAVAVAQPTLFESALAARYLLFAALSGALAFAALNFAHRQDPRRIILLGGSLAGAQIVSPVSGLLFAASMPVVLSYWRAGRETSSTTGLLVLLLFLPTLAAIALLWPASEHDLAILRPALPEEGTSGAGAIAPLLALLPLVPSLVVAALGSPVCARIVGGVAYILCAGALISQFFSLGDYSNAVLTSTGPLIAVVLGGLPRSRTRERSACLCAFAGLSLTWAIGLSIPFL